MKNVTIAGAVLISILGVGYIATRQQVEPVAPMTNTSDVKSDVIEDDMEVTIGDRSIEANSSEEDINREPTTEIASRADLATDAADTEIPGRYQEYSATALASSDADTKVLFFHASWCPSCRALDSDITTNQDGIPAGVAIFKADFDTETKLKQEFGVVRQHSIVVLDSEGAVVRGVTHPATLAQLVSSL